MSTTLTTGAESVEWDLQDLYEGPEDPRLEQDLEQALADAKRFRERYHGRLGELSAAELADATAELERIYSIVSRADTFAGLRFASDRSEEAPGALVHRVQ